jgi:hypothetical protein
MAAVIAGGFFLLAALLVMRVHEERGGAVQVTGERPTEVAA